MSQIQPFAIGAIEPAKPELASSPALVYLASLGHGSRRTMRQALNVMAGILTSGQCDAITLPWWLLRYQHTVALRAQLQERYAPATANKMLSALKRVLLECRRLGLMTADECTNASDLRPIKGSPLLVGRALSRGEIAVLMEVCCTERSPSGFRDAAMMAILMSGLRRSEVVAVNLEDYNPETGEIKVIGGKGKKDRTTYTPLGGMDALADWLKVRGDAPGALLNPVNKGGVIKVGKQMSDQAVLDMLMKRATQAGIKNISPHDFRRTFISNLLDVGADISTVQKLAGHASPDTTCRYDRRGEETKRKAVAKLELPYRRVER